MTSLLFASLLCSLPLQGMATQPELIAEIQKKNVRGVILLLQKGADPNSKQLVTSKPSATEGIAGGKITGGLTALDLATESGSIPLVRALLDYKADPNGRSVSDWTPLMTASQRGYVDVVKLLLKRGAKPNLQSDYGDTAIIYAANVDRSGVAKALLAGGADPNGGKGQTTLGEACQSSSLETVKVLLASGVDVNFHRKGCLSPLEYATTQGYNDEVTILLKKAGAKGRSPEVIKKENADSLRRMLKERDAGLKSLADNNKQFAKIKPEDNSLLEVAIADMASYGGKDFELSYGKSPNLVLIDESIGAFGDYEEGQMNGELSERQANDIDLEMRKDLLRRNSRKISLASFQFKSKFILFQHKIDPNPAGYWFDPKAKAKGYVGVFLPGYSADGTSAVLRFSFGPTPHGASGTYFMRLQQGKWIVVWRCFAHYV